MNPSARILISGAGVAGLCATLWLGRAGFRPVVVEKAPDVRAGGYLVSLSDQAYRFAQELGLTDALTARSIGITASSYHDASGRALLSLDYEEMFGSLNVVQMMRDDLVALLYERAADLAEFRFDTQICEMEEREDGTRVRFADGRTGTFDVVIGADGLHSGVRRAAFEERDFTRHRLGLWCAAYRLPNVLGLRAKFETHMEQDRYMAVFTTRQDDLGAVLVWADAWGPRPPARDRLAALEAAFAGANPTIRAVLEHAPADGDIYIDALEQIELPVWHRGRSVLLGDAAHCLTLFSGRGAGAAFAGASRLARAMIALERPDAFARYEAETRPVIADIQPATRRAVKWYVPRNALIHQARGWGMRLLPNAVFNAYFRAKYAKV